MKCKAGRGCGCEACETWKLLHLLMCADPGCEVSICRAARKYNRALGAVQVFDPAETAKCFIESRLPLKRLLLLDCPACGGNLLVTLGQLSAWERESGEPLALACSGDCASKVAAELAAGLRD
jgi:hypothetical protein